MRMDRTITNGDNTISATVECNMVSALDERGSYKLLELLYRCCQDPDEVPLTPLRLDNAPKE